jgi:hypothetical protein
MSIAKCVVRLKDSHDTEHSVVVYAESLYEAVLRGLNRLTDVGWESNTDETIKQVEVEIHQEPTRHTLNVPNLPLRLTVTKRRTRARIIVKRTS